jgi:hypothetical protein
MVESEIVSKAKEWATLKTINEGFVCVHSLNVLYLVMHDRLYLQMNANEQNILQWAALFHDICKLGPPRFEGKDHIHPFKGGR